MSFLPGISEMQMETTALPLGEFIDTYKGKWEARLSIVEGKEPTVQLIGSTPGAVYNLSSFLAITPAEKQFRIAGGFVDDPVWTLPPEETQEIARRALERLSALDGHFEVRWVPNDPRIPF